MSVIVIYCLPSILKLSEVDRVPCHNLVTVSFLNLTSVYLIINLNIPKAVRNYADICEVFKS